jgi:hypothetical protein
METRLMRQKFRYLLVLMCLFSSSSLMAQNIDHSAWDVLLKKHLIVKQNGAITQVDYAAFAKDRKSLKGYLKYLSAIEESAFDQLSTDAQLAMLINLYNAATVELILTGFPEIDSIKELGSLFRSPWKKDIVWLFGKQISLDDLEHGLIRSQKYQDPRIHFAVNCASIGCPALRAEAFVGDRLQEQLYEQTRLFLSDRTRNRLAGGQLEVSSIFKWYREDFEKGWHGFDSLEQFLAEYADVLGLNEQQVIDLNKGHIEIEFLDYDWRLNGK